MWESLKRFFFFFIPLIGTPPPIRNRAHATPFSNHGAVPRLNRPGLSGHERLLLGHPPEGLKAGLSEIVTVNHCLLAGRGAGGEPRWLSRRRRARPDEMQASRLSWIRVRPPPPPAQTGTLALKRAIFPAKSSNQQTSQPKGSVGRIAKTHPLWGDQRLGLRPAPSALILPTQARRYQGHRPWLTQASRTFCLSLSLSLSPRQTTARCWDVTQSPSSDAVCSVPPAPDEYLSAPQPGDAYAEPPGPPTDPRPLGCSHSRAHGFRWANPSDNPLTGFSSDLGTIIEDAAWHP